MILSGVAFSKDNSVWTKINTEIQKKFNIPLFIAIPDGKKFKVSNDDIGIITDGTTECSPKLFSFSKNESIHYCTEMKTTNNSKVLVSLIVKDNKIKEHWTVKNNDGRVQVLRPNGFKVEVVKNMQ